MCKILYFKIKVVLFSDPELGLIKFRLFKITSIGN